VGVGVVLLLVFGFFGELLDSALGMLYGTILSPVLILLGYDPLIVVPSILLTQAIGGLIAASVHHRLRNVDFGVDGEALKGTIGLTWIRSLRKATTRDLKVTGVIALLGVAASVFAAYVATSIPKAALNTYIGVLVLAMGGLLVSSKRFAFSWKKMSAIGVLSAFNKALSGGGFGPVVTAGQMISGRDGAKSVGATTLAEAPICIAGFVTYILRNGMQSWELVLWLGIGAIGGALVGPFLTAKFRAEKRVRIGLGALVAALGIWMLIQTWLL
jgi:uncharacterized membrane protein YfcA